MTEATWLIEENPSVLFHAMSNWPSPGTGHHPLLTDRKDWLFACAIYELQHGYEATVKRGFVEDGWNMWNFIPLRECARVLLHSTLGDQCCQQQADLFRDIIGNPFDHVELPRCYACNGKGDRRHIKSASGAVKACGPCFGSGVLCPWLTSTAILIAQGIYEDRAFDRLPVLADALEEAGCVDQRILLHCREDGVHARGCWVLDLLLGKE